MWYSKLFLFLLLFTNLQSEHLAVVVSKNSTLTSINKKELSKIFLAKTRNLPNGERAITLEITNKTYQKFFYEKITNKNSKQLKRYWAKMIFTGRGQPPKKFNSLDELINFIQNNKNAISYIPYKDKTDNLKTILEIQ